MNGEQLIENSIKTAITGPGYPLIDDYEEFPTIPNPGLPTFRVRLGQNTENVVDVLGVIVSVVFYVVYVDFQCPNNSAGTSNAKEELFEIVAAYTPPVPGIGDLIQIDKLSILTIDPPNYAIGRDKQTIRRATLICEYHQF